MVFHWTLSDSKSPQVSRTLLSILVVLNNVVVWMVSTRPPTSKSSSAFSNLLVTVPIAPIRIGMIVTCMFHSFFQFPRKVEVLILLFPFFQFYSVVSRDSKVDYFASSLLFFCWLLLSLVFWPGLGDPFIIIIIIIILYYYYFYLLLLLMIIKIIFPVLFLVKSYVRRHQTLENRNQLLVSNYKTSINYRIFSFIRNRLLWHRELFLLFNCSAVFFFVFLICRYLQVINKVKTWHVIFHVVDRIIFH